MNWVNFSGKGWGHFAPLFRKIIKRNNFSFLVETNHRLLQIYKSPPKTTRQPFSLLKLMQKPQPLHLIGFKGYRFSLLLFFDYGLSREETYQWSQWFAFFSLFISFWFNWSFFALFLVAAKNRYENSSVMFFFLVNI